MIKKLFRWLIQLVKSDELYKVEYVDEVPDKLHLHAVYIIVNEGYSWQAAMVCPCGCKKILNMNLIKKYSPFWKVEIHKNETISLHPSINRTVGCKSHFFIRKGRIAWC